jgi:hypothetical protein
MSSGWCGEINLILKLLANVLKEGVGLYKPLAGVPVGAGETQSAPYG